MYGRDIEGIHVGQKARVTIPDENLTAEAVVLLVLPDVDQGSRAYRVRMQMNNPGMKLRPGMLADVEMTLQNPAGLTVPVDAIVDSGAQRRVFVRTAESRFTPRIIRTGRQIGERIQVLEGLKEGDMVVDSGAFLLDSEARLRDPGVTH